MAQQGFTIRGRVGATDQEAQEGYFAIDSQTMIVVKPGSELHAYMRSRVGQRVRITHRAGNGIGVNKSQVTSYRSQETSPRL